MDTRRYFLVPLLAAVLALFSATASSAEADQKNADYWYKKGALAATYGADRYAVRYFEKVIAIDPNRSDAWFEMGVSYGELRWFDKAIAAVNRAIELRPESGLYYYGRGRIYLMLGAKDRAMEDFKQAEKLGSQDARNYLRREQEAEGA